MRRLGLDKVLQKVWLLGVEVVVFALQAGCHVLDGNTGDVGDVGWAERIHGVLVENVISPGHLAAESQVVDALVRGRKCAIVVVTFLHVAELFAESHDSEKVPRV